MANNPLIDVAQAMMIDFYGLEEEKYELVSVKLGNKTIPITMDDGYIPLNAKFPRFLVETEHMERMMTFEERVTKIRKEWEAKRKIPELWMDRFINEIETMERQMADEEEGKREAQQKEKQEETTNDIDLAPGEKKPLKKGKNKVKIKK